MYIPRKESRMDISGFSLYQMMNYQRIIVHVQRQARKAANRRKDEALLNCKVRLITNVHVQQHEHKHHDPLLEDEPKFESKSTTITESKPIIEHES